MLLRNLPRLWPHFRPCVRVMSYHRPWEAATSVNEPKQNNHPSPPSQKPIPNPDLEKVVSESLVKNTLDTSQIKDVRDYGIIFKLYPYGGISEELKNIFEDVVITDITRRQETIDFEDLTYLITALAQTKKRPLKILKTLCSLIGSKAENVTDINPGHIAQAICSLGSMNYLHVKAFNALSTLLCKTEQPFTEFLKKNVFVSLVINLGLTRYCNPELLDTISQSFPTLLNSRSRFSVIDFAPFLLTLAKLNYHPPTLDGVYDQHIEPFKLQRSHFYSDRQWIDYLWSLTFFNLKLSPKQMKSIMPKSEIMTNIESRVASDQSVLPDLNKIRNILAIHGYLTKNVQPIDPAVKTPDCIDYANQVIDTLNFFVPKNTFMETKIRTGLGFQIDARFVVKNLDKKPVELAEFKAGGFPRSQVTPINVITASYRNLLLSDFSKVTGNIVMTKRIIEKVINESVVIVPQSTFRAKIDNVQRTNYLQQLIVDSLSQPLERNEK